MEMREIPGSKVRAGRVFKERTRATQLSSAANGNASTKSITIEEITKEEENQNSRRKKLAVSRNLKTRLLNSYDKKRQFIPIPKKFDLRPIVLEQIDQYFICKICKEIMRDATVIRECMHRFCAKCINDRIKSGLNKCPSCDLLFPKKFSLKSDPSFDTIIRQVEMNVDARMLSNLASRAQSEISEPPLMIDENYDSSHDPISQIESTEVISKETSSSNRQGMSSTQESGDLSKTNNQISQIEHPVPLNLLKNSINASADFLLHDKQRLLSGIETELILYPDASISSDSILRHIAKIRFIEVPSAITGNLYFIIENGVILQKLLLPRKISYQTILQSVDFDSYILVYVISVGHLREFLYSRLALESGDKEISEKYQIVFYALHSDFPIEKVIVVSQKSGGQFVAINVREPNTDPSGVF
ncbi:unnamed protein product [Dracunculus medinensis]|uniref:RING-type E3 ubiquitin transferase n=1 Tax=Dracunculus medinensis TaxID=318479 RepID=A0A0N4U3Q6_DRAME|nr:unnamed protein product [Dracunculus medinensis]